MPGPTTQARKAARVLGVLAFVAMGLIGLTALLSPSADAPPLEATQSPPDTSLHPGELLPGEVEVPPVEGDYPLTLEVNGITYAADCGAIPAEIVLEGRNRAVDSAGRELTVAAIRDVPPEDLLAVLGLPCGSPPADDEDWRLALADLSRARVDEIAEQLGL